MTGKGEVYATDKEAAGQDRDMDTTSEDTKQISRPQTRTPRTAELTYKLREAIKIPRSH